jgi:nucleotide-binding universal stress UspA family protein
MQGTLLCGVTDTEEGLDAAAMAAELSKRLGLRLVLAHVEDGLEAIGEDGDGNESVSMRGSRERAARAVARVAAKSGADDAIQRAAVGDPATLIGQIAAEEAADVVVVSARARGRFRRRLETSFAERLESETPVPVLIAPPRPRARNGIVTERGQR